MYLLFVAGEASGDRLGAPLVALCRAWGYEARGAGGLRMRQAGLNSIVDFSKLGVQGFWDVLPRFFALRSALYLLRRALFHDQCAALVCIDYPGFNLRLDRWAQSLGKPVFWIAPPQFWAWKPKRGLRFQGKEVAVLFPFEQVAYERVGAMAVQVRHPLCAEVACQPQRSLQSPMLWAMLAGSRMGQAGRNVSFYLRMAQVLEQRVPGSRAIFVVPGPQEQRCMQAWLGAKAKVVLAEHCPWDQVRGALCPPGTASLELGLRAIPFLVASRIDLLTYALGRLFLHVPSLAMPNLLFGRRVVPEWILPALPWGPSHKDIEHWIGHLLAIDVELAQSQAETLQEFLHGPTAGEVFEQFLQRLPNGGRAEGGVCCK